MTYNNLIATYNNTDTAEKIEVYKNKDGSFFAQLYVHFLFTKVRGKVSESKWIKGESVQIPYDTDIEVTLKGIAIDFDSSRLVYS